MTRQLNAAPPAANCWPNPSVPGERKPPKLLVLENCWDKGDSSCTYWGPSKTRNCNYRRPIDTYHTYHKHTIIAIINSCGIRIAHTFGMTNAPYVAKSSLDGKDLVLWDLMVAETVFFTCMEILLSVNTLSSISVSEWLSSHNHLLGVLFEHLLMESPRARSAILIHCPPMQSPSLLSPSGDLMTDLSKLSTVVQYQR